MRLRYENVCECGYLCVCLLRVSACASISLVLWLRMVFTH